MEAGVIDDREERPRPLNANRFIPPATLDGWSVDELRDYVVALQAEIARAEVAIASRQNHRSAADAFFRKS